MNASMTKNKRLLSGWMTEYTTMGDFDLILSR